MPSVASHNWTRQRPSLQDNRRVRRRSEILIRWIRDAPRWIFLGALLYAPWDYGCTTERSMVDLNWILSAALVLWIIDLLIARRLPLVPFALIIISVVLLG